jgi:5'-phosphate synthase pdxT subunit
LRVGILGFQGAIQDHIQHLKGLGATVVVVKKARHLAEIDRLILPGGESTVMAKFLNESAMTTPLREKIHRGMPTWGICAGAILLAKKVDHRPGSLGVMALSATRNAYGRQMASQMIKIAIPALGNDNFEAFFIRAPKLEPLCASVQVLAHLGRDGIFFQKGRIMATTFHPELTQDPLLHRYFLDI